jgi:Trypsin
MLRQVAEPFEYNEYVQQIALPEQMQPTEPGTPSVVAGWGSEQVSFALT